MGAARPVLPLTGLEDLVSVVAGRQRRLEWNFPDPGSEGDMRLNLCAASACAALIAVTTCGNPAGAEPKKKQVESSQSQTTATKRARTRITVEPRSFLDAGTTPIPGEPKYLDYAFPPGYSPLREALGPFRDYRRQPLLDPWDFPGVSKGW